MPFDLQVVLGTGGIGRALVQALAAQGAQVRAVNRSGRGQVAASVEVMAADLTSPESTRAACQGAAVVYHCAGLPYNQWAAYLPWALGVPLFLSVLPAIVLADTAACCVLTPALHA